MHTRRFRALAVAGIATAVLSGVVAGGLANAAAAAPAPHDDTTATGADALKPAMKLAQEHARQVTQLHAGRRKARAATDCGNQYPNANGSVIAQRWAGTDRYAVSVCVSYGTWFDGTDTDPDHQPAVADAVVLAKGDAYADALAGGPLSAWAEGPLLLTKTTSLPSTVAAEIKRVLAPGGKVYLLGGTGSISAGVEHTIATMGYRPDRIGGANRFEVAVNIAQRIKATNRFFVTNGMNFPDALGAGNAASALTVGARYDDTGQTLPVVVLFTNNTAMPAVTANFALQRRSDFDDDWLLLTAGGAGNAAAEKAFPGKISVPYVGRTRYDTATLIDEDVFTDLDTKLVSQFVGLVDGTNYPDALTGSVMLSGLAAPLLLTPPTKLDAAPATFLLNHAGDPLPSTSYVSVFGGPASVSDSVMVAARTAFTPTA